MICAKSNYQLLKKQIYKYNPKYAFLYDIDKLPKFNYKINKTKILNFNELINYLLESKSNLTVLAISGYKSLYFLESIIQNTDYLGLANKESIVSAGHLLKRKNIFPKQIYFPWTQNIFLCIIFLVKLNKTIIT